MSLVTVPLRAKLIMSKRMPTSTVKPWGWGAPDMATGAARGRSRRETGVARNARRERRNAMAERDCTAKRQGCTPIGFSRAYDKLVRSRSIEFPPVGALREALCEDPVAW